MAWVLRLVALGFMSYDIQTAMAEKLAEKHAGASGAAEDAFAGTGEVRGDAGRNASLAEDLLWIVEVVRSNLLWLLLALVPALGVAFAYLYVASPRYTASAQILINTQEVKVTGGASVFSSLAHDPQLMDTKLAVLNSTEVAKRALKNLNLPQQKLFGKNSSVAPKNSKK